MVENGLLSDGDINRLLAIMARLRSPGRGCPWDLEQTFATIAPYTIEEAYEVADAIHDGDLDHLKDELGDLLLQVVFHAQMAEEQSAFAFADVVRTICDKMIRRHPHVFGDGDVRTAEEQTAAWEAQKAAERQAQGASRSTLTSTIGGGSSALVTSVLDGVPVTLPALMRGHKLQKRAAAVGFDWPDAGSALYKLEEEAQELADEINADADRDRLEDEIGDVLFSAVNVARKLGIDPETALCRTNKKFERRFKKIEEALAKQGKTPADSSLEEMDALWEIVKVENGP